MKNAANYIVWFTFLVMVIYFISLFLPSNTKVTHSEIIYGDIKDVYAQFDQINNWSNWCVWNTEVKKNQIIYSDLESGPGAFFRWKHGNKNRSNGKLEIINSKKLQSIEFKIKASSIDSIESYVHFQKTKEGTLVEWTSDLELQNSGTRLMGYFLKRWLIRDIKKSLRNINLYLLAENKHTGWVSDEFQILESKNTNVFSLKDTILHRELDSTMNENFNQIKATLSETSNFVPKSFFYRKESNYNSNASIYLFGTYFPSEISIPGAKKDFSGKYLLIKFYGSEIGFKRGIKRAKEIAKKQKFRIDPNPFIGYNYYPLDASKMDTNNMTLNFLIR